MVVLNKDGMPRKPGSGKTKGAGCFTKIPWNDLKKYVGAEVELPVSRVWLRSLGVPVEQYAEKPPESSQTEKTTSGDSKATAPQEDAEGTESQALAETAYRYSQNFDL